MSLIERAVGRLASGSEDPPPAQPPVSHAKVSTIEAFVEHMAQANDPAAASAVEPPPSPPGDPAARRAVAVHVQTEALASRGFVTLGAEQSRIAQEFRVIKRPLIANAFGKGVTQVRHGKRVMVTSAFPGEGKSFCAINLALSIAAERDHKVLLVDADVARPSIPRTLGFAAEAGLMDWLIDGNRDVAEFVLSTDIEKLAILPSGRQHPQATEFLASAAMSRMLDQISARFPDRIVIFDSPPLLVTTEARVLASYMGQIVMVVEAGKTPRSAVTEALGTIEGTAEVIGMVLNKAQGFGAGGYGSYYGYGGYGYGHAEERRA